MKKIILFAFFMFITLSVSQDISNTNKVKYDTDLKNGNLMYESDLNDKSYSFRSETADGQIHSQSGHFEDENLVVEGAHEYVGEKNFKSSVIYIADSNGSRYKVLFGTKLAARLPGVRPSPRPATTLAPTRATRLPPKPTKKPAKLRESERGSLIGSYVKRSPKIDERNIISLLNTFFKYLENENGAKPRF